MYLTDPSGTTPPLARSNGRATSTAPKAESVQPEDALDAETRDQQGRQRGADQDGTVERPTVETDRAHHVFGCDQLGQQRFPCRAVKGLDDGGAERKQKDVPRCHQAERGNDGQARLHQGGGRLSDIEDCRPRHPVGHDAAYQRKTEERNSPHQADEAEP